MFAVCEDCGKGSDSSVGYCECSGVRICTTPISDFVVDAGTWPASPLIKSRIPGLAGVLLKYEGTHPSGSFKDRIMRLAVTEAVRSGASGVVVPSSGNAALSAAGACAAAGIPMVALVPMGTAIERIAPVLARGAVVLEAGYDPSAAYQAAKLVAAELGLMPLYSTFAAPIAEWACRMIGVEITRQMGGAPSTLVAPISAGPILLGTANGILQETGHRPRLVAAQANGCCPIVKAFEAGRDTVEEWQSPIDTAATSIADRLSGYPQDGTYTLRALRQTGGAAVAVSDDEMRLAREALLFYDGLDVEFSSTAGVAWLRREEPDSSSTVCVLTASGFKHTYRGDCPRPARNKQQDAIAATAQTLIQKNGIPVKLA